MHAFVSVLGDDFRAETSFDKSTNSLLGRQHTGQPHHATAENPNQVDSKCSCHVHQHKDLNPRTAQNEVLLCSARGAGAKVTPKVDNGQPVVVDRGSGQADSGLQTGKTAAIECGSEQATEGLKTRERGIRPAAQLPLAGRLHKRTPLTLQL